MNKRKRSTRRNQRRSDKTTVPKTRKKRKKKTTTTNLFPPPQAMKVATKIGDFLMTKSLERFDSQFAVRWAWETPELVGLKILQKNPPGLNDPEESLDVIRSCHLCGAEIRDTGSGSVWYGPNKTPSMITIMFHCATCKPPTIPSNARLDICWTEAKE